MSIQGTAAPVLALKDYLTQQVSDPNKFHNSGLPPVMFDRILVVPPWQREYVWEASETGQVGQLLLDLEEFVSSDDTDYLMGSILLSHGGKEFNQRLLIDGQQRTLTYSILLMCVLKYVQNFKDEVHHLGNAESNALEDATLTDIRKCISREIDMYSERVSMPQSGANEALQMIFYWSKLPEGQQQDYFTTERENWTPTQRNLVEVALWIYEKKLKGQNWLPNEKLLKHMKKVIEGVKFLEVTLSTQREAIAIFDRINSRGARLNSGDLIKNLIFQAVESDDDFAIISGSWTAMDEMLAQCSSPRIGEPKFLLRALALADHEIENFSELDLSEPDTKITAPKITYEKLTDYWGSKLKKEAGNGSSDLSSIDFAAELHKASSHLKAFSHEESLGGNPLRELYFARYLNCVQHFPMLMAGRNLENPKVLEHLTKQVHARTSYYLLSQERTQEYESMVPTWTSLIANTGNEATIEDLDNIYNNFIRIPDSSIDSLVEQMMTWSYATGDKKKIRAVLSQLSRMVDAVADTEDSGSPISYFSTIVDDNKESWDIDHIYPKKGVKKDSHLHRIGNLVLLKAKHNQLKRAADPIKKKDVYEGSHLILTQNLVGITIDSERKKVEKLFAKAGIENTNWALDSWAEKDMNARAEMYGKLLKYHLTQLA